jgi:L-ribulose-5-phosphate 3-epimerase
MQKIRLIVFLLVVAISWPMVAQKASTHNYKVAVIDLMILKRQKLSAFPLAKEIGADGVEVDMGGLGNRPTFDNKLANDTIRQQFMDKAKELDLEIPSLAMTGFYAQSFPLREDVMTPISDCIATMKKMGVKVGFLPLGTEGDLAKYPDRRQATVDRLRQVGKMAKKAGVVIGIETALSASDELALLKEVGSPAIKIYFNISNPMKEGRDLYQELKILGRKNICMIHATNKDGVWLQNDPEVDLYKMKQTLDAMRWKGWLVVERSRDANNPRDVKGNFSANVAYLKKVFQEERQK